jgi:hypothetical protein
MKKKDSYEILNDYYNKSFIQEHKEWIMNLTLFSVLFVLIFIFIIFKYFDLF